MAKYVSDGQTTYEPDVDNLVQSVIGNIVQTGLTVVAQGTPNMTLNVASGTIKYGAAYVGSAGNNTLAVSAADPSNPRVDLVHVTSAGAVAIVTGTPSATPKPPALPATSILLAYISVAAAAANIQNSNITTRLIVGSNNIGFGTDANKIGPGLAGRMYAATDTGILYFDNGASVIPMSAAAVQPNLILNSDFARKTILPGAANFAALAMPETFADLLGWTKIDAGAAGSVAANVFTQGAANNEYACCAGAFVWRDARASATFKAVATAGIYQLKIRGGATQFVSAKQNNGNFTLTYNVGGGEVVLLTVANALTLNRWYWLELTGQGTQFVAKIFDTGGTVAGVSKASSTLLQTHSAPISIFNDNHISITSDQANAQWGGIAASPGGVYVEIPMPESCAFTFGGTLGGQAWGIDETADGGPGSTPRMQKVLRGYIPATSRTMTLDGATPAIAPNVAHTVSAYIKTSGKGGSGALTTMAFREFTDAIAYVTETDIDDATEVAWTRRTSTFTTGATTRRIQWQIKANRSSTATGTFYVVMGQVEQGSAATAWRNAPADDGALRASARATGANRTTTSAAFVETDSRDLAMNLDLPWDSVLDLDFAGIVYNGTVAAVFTLDITVDGVEVDWVNLFSQYVGGYDINASFKSRTSVAAGKHRIAVRWKTSAGTANLDLGNSVLAALHVTATRGK